VDPGKWVAKGKRKEEEEDDGVEGKWVALVINSCR